MAKKRRPSLSPRNRDLARALLGHTIEGTPRRLAWLRNECVHLCDAL